MNNNCTDGSSQLPEVLIQKNGPRINGLFSTNVIAPYRCIRCSKVTMSRSHRLKSEVSFPNWKLEGIKIDRSTQTAPTDADAQGIVLVIFEKYCNKICSKYEFQVLAFYQNFAWARNWLFQSVFTLQLNSFRPIDVGIEKTDLPKSYSQTVHCFTTYEIHVANWIL